LHPKESYSTHSRAQYSLAIFNREKLPARCIIFAGTYMPRARTL
jgi:hypothetical protein